MQNVAVNVHSGNGESQVWCTFLRNAITFMTTANKIMFFQKLAQLLKIMALPKQPQSVTGFANAIQSVTGVITHIKSKPTNDVSRIRIENKKLTPITNSMAKRANANVKAKG